MYDSCFGYPLFENEDFALGMDTYLRTDLVTLKNVVGLDSGNKSDSTVYLGMDYSLGLSSDFKNRNTKFYLRFERNGLYDYDAPLFIHNTLLTSAGVVERYRNKELLPQLEEFWLDAGLRDGLRFKIGLYTYEVGNGFSLNGSFENYGFTLSREWENSVLRFYYCRPDLVYKNRLGPDIPQEAEQDIRYHHNAANFFAADFKVNLDKGYLNPYIGALVDYTSEGKRDNIFSTPVKRDILGTIGMAWNGSKGDFSFAVETAHNFGKAESADPEGKDVYHTGYLFFTDLAYQLSRITPSFQFLLCSGNEVTPEMAEDGATTLASGKNRAFSYVSPTNINLGNSISSVNADARPIVAMGTGYGLNYGIPRPETFFAADFDNLIMPSLGCDFQATDKLLISVYGYYLVSFTRPVGMFEDQARYLSRELGSEVDFLLEYQLNSYTLINLLGGWFFPGRFYKEKRDDISGSLLTPFVRGDGEANVAYQIELAAEFKF
ncbi:MAG: hypothetical protein ACM3IL_03500 [Deltaproteobacteria bacterium]